ncbi:MAG TPA: hypothetical protein VF469_31165 [Kofleriaceae bacterium]
MTTATRTSGAALVALVFAAWPARPALAQSAEAESLFREGKRLMKKGDIAQACDKFEASDRVEPTASTELNLAVCREKNGQTATAWATFIKAATTAKHAGDAKREAEGNRRAAELEPQLVYLTIAVPRDSRVDGLVIKRKDAEIDPALWNQRVPVDPDEYTISGEAPGYRPWSTTVVVKTRSKRVEVPALEQRAEPRRGEARRRAAPVDAAQVDAEDRRAAPPSRFTGTRKLSLVLAAVGVAAAGAGVGLGLHASSVEADADKMCPSTACTKPPAVELNRSARRYALAANIGFAAGGAAVAGAVVLWFVGSPKPASQDTVSIVPMLGVDRAGISFGRSF